MTWWITVRVAGATHVWPVGDPDPVACEDLLCRARVQAGFPPRDDWLDEASFSVEYTAEPHPSVLAGAIVHTMAELTAVDPVAVTLHQQQRATAHRQVQLTAARAAAAQLHPDDKVTLRVELGPAPLADPATLSRTL